MSKVAEYHEDFDYISERFQKQEKEISQSIDFLSEKEKCKLYGIPCSYGICDECEEYERS